MDRSDWISIGVTLIAIWLAWYVGGARAATICGIIGFLILTGLILFRPRKENPNNSTPRLEQAVSPVITQQANPVITVNVGKPERSVDSPVISSGQPPRPNIKLVEAKFTTAHTVDGKLCESPANLGDINVAVASFRNEGLLGSTVAQPHVRAHIIFKDADGREIADVPSGVWLDEYKDTLAFSIGVKRNLVVLLLTRQGTLKRLWKESYTDENSWMGGPRFRVRDEGISERIGTIEISLLEFDSGVCIAHAILKPADPIDRGLPQLITVSFRTG